VAQAKRVGKRSRRTVYPLGRRSRKVTAWVVSPHLVDDISVVGVVVASTVALVGYHRSIPTTIVVHETVAGVTRTHFGGEVIKKIVKSTTPRCYMQATCM